MRRRRKSKMALRQISVLLENRPGTLVEVTDLVAAAGINLRAINVSDTSGFGILRLVVDKPELCEKVLKEAGKTVSLVRVLAVNLSDKPGGFSAMARILTENGHNIDYVYHYSEGNFKDASVVIRTDFLDEAESLLVSKGFKMSEE
jgi:hypothetical protein